MRSVSALGNLSGDFSHSISKARILQRVREEEGGREGEKDSLTWALQAQEYLFAIQQGRVVFPVERH
jgi:hypothetical protein